MPKGPKGEKRPADAVGAAVMVAKIATGEIEETAEDEGKNKAAVELGRKGGKARAKKLSKKRRVEIAKKAAAARWNAGGQVRVRQAKPSRPFGPKSSGALRSPSKTSRPTRRSG